MKIIFFGLGSIGKRHANLIKKNFRYQLYAFRSKKKNNDLGIEEVYSLEDVDKINPDVAFITNPTNLHLKYATYCAKKGMNIFLEKPISNSRKGLREFVRIAKRKKINVYVGYCLRFHPVIKWLKKYLEKNKPVHVTVNASSYLPNWRKGNHLKYYSASKKSGGGVILDLSHEIDYLYHLLGNVKNIKGNSGKLSNVTKDAEDSADILLRFKNKVFCNLHLSFMSRLNRREIIFDFKDHTVVADLVNSKVSIHKSKSKTKKFKFKVEDMYLDQLKYFFKGNNDLNEALKVFDIVMKIKKEAGA